MSKPIPYVCVACKEQKVTDPALSATQAKAVCICAPCVRGSLSEEELEKRLRPSY